MIFIAKNGGVIFFPSSNYEVIYLQKLFDCKMALNGSAVPSLLLPYYNGYYKDGTDNYSFDFSLLAENKLCFDVYTQNITKDLNKSLKNGLYQLRINTQTANYSVLGLFDASTEIFSGSNKPLPIHSETVKAIEEVKNEIDKLKSSFTSVINIVNSISNVISSTNAVPGSPLNPAFAGVIQNDVNAVTNNNEALGTIKDNLKKLQDTIKEK